MNATVKGLLSDVETIRTMRKSRAYNRKQVSPLIRTRDFKIYRLVKKFGLPIKMVAGFTGISYVSVHRIVKKYAKLEACGKSTE